VKDALGSSKASEPAVRSVVAKRFGPNAVAFDPSDPEGSKLAVSRGYEVVHGGSLSSEEWASVRRAGALPPAGSVTPSARVPSSPDGIPPLAHDQMTPAQRSVVEYARQLGKELIGEDVSVRLFPRFSDDQGKPVAAAYGHGGLSLSFAGLGGKAFFEAVTVDDYGAEAQHLDAVLLHEFGHHFVSDHLSADFHEKLCALGAKLRRIYVHPQHVTEVEP
jgi:hypothetical protein